MPNPTHARRSANHGPETHVECRETTAGSWSVHGLPPDIDEKHRFVSRERALEAALEKIGPMESWQVTVIDLSGRELATFNSEDDAMQWHVT